MDVVRELIDSSRGKIVYLGDPIERRRPRSYLSQNRLKYGPYRYPKVIDTGGKRVETDNRSDHRLKENRCRRRDH